MNEPKSLKECVKIVKRLQREQRQDYKRKADGYNSLANRSRSLPSDFATRADITISDIINDLEDRSLMPRVRRHRVNREFELINVSDEVRSTWHKKIKPLAPLSDDSKEKLREQVLLRTRATSTEADIYRNARLDALARAWVTTWLQGKLQLGLPIDRPCSNE